MRPSQRALGLVSGLVSVKEGGDESWSSLVAVGQEVDVMEHSLYLDFFLPAKISHFFNPRATCAEKPPVCVHKPPFSFCQS